MSVKGFSFFKAAMPLLLLSVLLCGCRSDRSYQAEAADKARKFLLENAPELSPAQVAYVRYNDPVLLVGNGLAGKSTGLKQICVTWQIPDADTLYMVSGFSRERMDNWYPNRVVRRNYVKPSPEINSAVDFCRRYAVTNFYNTLGKEDLNVIRFSNPEIVLSRFEGRPAGLVNDPNSHAMNKVEENTVAAPPVGRVQISLQWKISDHRYAVFCGYAADETLAGWQLSFAGYIADYEANEVRGKVLKMPDSFNTPVSVNKK